MNIVHLQTGKPRTRRLDNRQVRRRGLAGRIDKAAIGWIGAIAASVAGAALTLGWMAETDKAYARDDVTQCLESGEIPLAIVVAVDQTDPLAASAGQRFAAIMNLIKQRVPRGGRLIVVPFDGDLGKSPVPVFDYCSPGTAEEASSTEGSARLQRAYDRNFSVKVDEVARDLQNNHSTGYSPIAQQIDRIFTDPAIARHGDHCEILLISDGLQSVPGANIYRGQAMRFPEPVPGRFAHCEVHYFELANPTRFELQTPANRAALEQWFAESGARPSMHAPGYPTSNYPQAGEL